MVQKMVFPRNRFSAVKFAAIEMELFAFMNPKTPDAVIIGTGVRSCLGEIAMSSLIPGVPRSWAQ